MYGIFFFLRLQPILRVFTWLCCFGERAIFSHLLSVTVTRCIRDCLRARVCRTGRIALSSHAVLWCRISSMFLCGSTMLTFIFLVWELLYKLADGGRKIKEKWWLLSQWTKKYLSTFLNHCSREGKIKKNTYKAVLPSDYCIMCNTVCLFLPVLYIV